MNKTIAIMLPARRASTRLPDKLLLDRTGKTLLEHTIEQALKAQRASGNLITAVIAACDDEALMRAARRGGAEAVLTRPDHVSGTDRIAEAAAQRNEDIVINLQADEPELEPETILTLARSQANAPEDTPMSTLAVPITNETVWQSSSVVKVVVDGQGHAMYFSRAPIPFVRDASEHQTAPDAWAGPDELKTGQRIWGLHHLGLYAYRRDFLLGYQALPESRLEHLEKLEQLRALEAGYKIRVGVVKASPPGIDTPQEYEAFVKRHQPATPAIP